jgi:hypothetical protein
MTDNGSRFFCRVSGVRLVAPGVSKSIDQQHGVAEWTESAAAPTDEHPPAAKPKGKKEQSE